MNELHSWGGGQLFDRYTLKKQQVRLIERERERHTVKVSVGDRERKKKRKKSTESKYYIPIDNNENVVEMWLGECKDRRNIAEIEENGCYSK